MTAPGIDPRLQSALADRYLLERELGQGGMATVYLAEDVRHRRKVAIKIMRPELALAADRFLLEIRVTAGLQHPGIVPLFDSGRAGGQPYYVMPFVEGESLRQRLERERRIPLDEALEIGRHVASVLDYAHQQHVVHRDIKPENIMLSRGQALVADFGIARALSEAGGDRMTATGHSLGTPAYMSPEQALGESAIDGRSDIYSLGCVLYEMLEGEPPFVAPTLHAMIARRLAEPPPRLASVPPPVSDTIRRALATQRADRFATAADLGHALATAAQGGAAGRDAGDQRLSVVVLPLENMSPDPDNAYFADGLTEEIIADLSHIRDLRVISRTSALKYRGTDKDIPTIARELGVRYVLAGSVRRAGTSIRVTAQLIEAEPDDHKWSGKFTGSIDDVFAIQERLSREIVDALKVTLSPADVRKIGGRRAGQLAYDATAYDLYMKLRHEIWKMSREGLTRARALMQEAESIVDENAPLLAAKAYVLFQTLNLGIEVDESLRSEAESLAKRALALDPDCAQAHAVMGWLRTSDGRAIEGLRHVARARELDPADSDLDILAVSAGSLTGVGDPVALAQQVRELVARDPLTPLNHWAEAIAAMFRGDFTTALASLQRARRMDPSSPYSFFLGLVLSELGRVPEALDMFAPLASQPEATTWDRMGAAWWHALRGNADDARALITDDLRDWARPDMQYAWHLAQLHAAIGDVDDALDWLETAIDREFFNHPFLAKHERLLDPLRQERRFAQLLDRVRAEWERHRRS